MNFTSREKVRERGRETGGMKAFQSRLKTSDHNGVKNERERESSNYIYTHTHIKKTLLQLQQKWERRREETEGLTSSGASELQPGL